MKNLIATVALAATAACGAQYPLNRVASVADKRPDGVLSNDVEGIVRLYDETNLTPRVSAIEATASGKQDRLLAGDNVTLTPTGTGTVVVAVGGGSAVPDGWTSVSNAAMSARRPADNVSHVTEVAEFGPWNLAGIDVLDPDGAPHECRLRELTSSPGTFVWTIYKSGSTDPTWCYSQWYSGREEAEQVTSFRTEGQWTGIEISRPVLSVWSMDGEHFITPVFVTNRVAALETYTNRVGTLETYTNRVAALGTYTNRVASLETYTNRVAALETYTNRVAAIETYTNRVAALETYTNRAAAAVVSDAYMNVSIGEMSSCGVNAIGSFAGGWHCTNVHMYAWAWNGSGTPYKSQGNGTFAVNPPGGADRFYIGELSLTEVIANVVSNLAANGKLGVSTNWTSQAAEGWHVIMNPD